MGFFVIKDDKLRVECSPLLEFLLSIIPAIRYKEDFVWQGTSSPGVGVLRFNGAAWETGWHFCPRDSLNVIINQPTSLFFEAPSNGITMSEQGGYRDGVHNSHSSYFIFSFFLHGLCPTHMAGPVLPV